MWKQCLAQVTLAGVFAARLQAAVFAQTVEGYAPGTGFATEYGTGLGYTDAATALGQPNHDTTFGAVTPFNPPFDRSELVSIGAGGHLVVSMETPVRNLPTHPFGLDFIIYANTGFMDVDYPNGLTDEQGFIFGQNPGVTRVSVSRDNLLFFTLDPAVAPVVDGLYPTDGAGLFGLPVNPALAQSAFANQDLAGIRALYAGSAGGAGFDLAWARDAEGQPVALDEIRFIRVDVLTGHAEIDGFAVVPEPGSGVLAGLLALGGTVVACLRTRPRSGCRERVE